MLYILFPSVMSEDEASAAVGRKMIKYVDSEFRVRANQNKLNYDMFFIKCCREIDQCDIPVANVLRDLRSGETHSFDRVSGGVMSMWLMYHYSEEFLFPTAYFGENCYQILLDMSTYKDVYVYDNAGMVTKEEAEKCIGKFTDFHTGIVVNFGDNKAFDYAIDIGYQITTHYLSVKTNHVDFTIEFRDKYVLVTGPSGEGKSLLVSEIEDSISTGIGKVVSDLPYFVVTKGMLSTISTIVDKEECLLICDEYVAQDVVRLTNNKKAYCFIMTRNLYANYDMLHRCLFKLVRDSNNVATLERILPYRELPHNTLV